MSSLDCLPTEVIYHILTDLDTETIFLCLYKVCKRFRTIIDSYQQYQLDLTFISKTNFSLISHRIKCHNIFSLTISNEYQTPGQIQYFFHMFDLDQFTRLRSLTLLQLNRRFIKKIFQSKIISSLYSLKLQLRQNLSLQYDLSKTFASILEKSILTKLDFNLWFSSMKIILWPNKCLLKYLKIHACSVEGYLTILRQTPYLETFVVDDLKIYNKDYAFHNSRTIETFDHLKSLTLQNCCRNLYQIQCLLLITPSLTYLKIVSDTNLIDGYQWEQFIQIHLPLLKTFEFYFEFYLNEQLKHDDIELLIRPYLTPFWIEIKRWFVICEYTINEKEIRLYSIPLCKSDYTYHFDSTKIVVSTSLIMENSSLVMNQVSKLYLNWTKIMDSTIEYNHFPNQQLFCKLIKLTLAINRHCPWNSLQILSKLINLSSLRELTLRVTFDNNYISNVIKNIKALLTQTSNVHSLLIICSAADDADYDRTMKIFYSIIPYHVKYFNVKFLKYYYERIVHDMEIISDRHQ